MGARAGTRKIVASAPIDVKRVDTWKEFLKAKHGLMALNGDSSRLAVPDSSVDAVITDPPYFDFVHYSELSDFFFAWLSPALKARYPWMSRADSSDKGEVQHKDPRVFARQLASVFSECRRVLKDDGVLAFSFHHSRPEGWAAIYEALATAGLCVVAAHPVHAELRAASPKNAAKAPISLDAILVCRKVQSAGAQVEVDSSPISYVETYAKTLEASGLTISSGDRFVIAAAQTLIRLSGQELSFEDVEEQLHAVHGELAAERGYPQKACGVADLSTGQQVPPPLDNRSPRLTKALDNRSPLKPVLNPIDSR